MMKSPQKHGVLQGSNCYIAMNYMMHFNSSALHK